VVAGEGGWAGPLAPEACRRLACDGAVTRVLVTRPPTDSDHGPAGPDQPPPSAPCGEQGLAGRLHAAMAVLPPVPGGAPRQPLDLGRATRVVQPAQRSALAVRDGGCVFPDCARPLAWCEGHHLVPWLEGGPTDLPNLALLCRAHHRAVHEGGWRLVRGPDGRLTAHPPHRRPRAAA
jgi:HNH endonuclease